jgi:hypothetical protein
MLPHNTPVCTPLDQVCTTKWKSPHEPMCCWGPLRFIPPLIFLHSTTKNVKECCETLKQNLFYLILVKDKQTYSTWGASREKGCEIIVFHRKWSDTPNIGALPGNYHLKMYLPTCEMSGLGDRFATGRRGTGDLVRTLGWLRHIRSGLRNVSSTKWWTEKNTSANTQYQH